MLQEGEVLCRYDGTMKHLTEAEIDDLEKLHQNDGNGIIQVNQSMGRVQGTPSVKNKAWVIDPYVLRGTPRTSVTAPGVWANHCVRGRQGCNMKMVAKGQVGPDYQAFLVTTTALPKGVELLWDYGIRDPDKPWLN